MDDSELLSPFLVRLDAGPKRGKQPPPAEDESPDEAVAPGDAYATARGQRMAVALTLIWKDGTYAALPYALLPLVWGHPPGLLLVEYPGFFTVGLQGRNLDGLAWRIADHRVTWIRECDEATAAVLPAAVTGINLLPDYPSRTRAGG